MDPHTRFRVLIATANDILNLRSLLLLSFFFVFVIIFPFLNMFLNKYFKLFAYGYKGQGRIQDFWKGGSWGWGRFVGFISWKCLSETKLFHFHRIFKTSWLPSKKETNTWDGISFLQFYSNL